jgi:hypothetical protein
LEFHCQHPDQTVENMQKILGGPNRKTELKPKIRPLWGDFFENLIENAVKNLI